MKVIESKKVMEGHGRSRKVKEVHRWSWKIMENYGRPWKVKEGQGSSFPRLTFQVRKVVGW